MLVGLGTLPLVELWTSFLEMWDVASYRWDQGSNSHTGGIRGQVM